MDMDAIIEALYLGSRQAACDIDGLLKAGVTHVLTIDAAPLGPGEVSDKLKYHYVQALDMPQSDLLTHFKECFDFIDKARQEGAVLIHCLVGVSRSATITTAYIMRLKKIGMTEALNMVADLRLVRPNKGFQEQLLMFEAMGCEIEEGNELYRKYKLERMADRIQRAGVEEVEFKAGELLANPADSPGNDSYFRCAKCRQALFRRQGIRTHSEGSGNFGKHAQSVLHQSDIPCVRSLFIEPVQWMAPSIRQQQGKLHCPKCQVKLGSYVWFGEKCPCGAWVAPAFHIQTSKVDECRPTSIPHRHPVGSTEVKGEGHDVKGFTLLTKHTDPMGDADVQPAVT